jgi:hypothetical protein
LKILKVDFSDSACWNSLRKRIKKLESSLEYYQHRLEEQPQSVPPSSTSSSPPQPEVMETIAVLTPSRRHVSLSKSPVPPPAETGPVETSIAHVRPTIFVEGSRKRWGARSALGKSCNPLEWPEDIIETWVPAIDPKLQTIYRLGLPGADEPPKSFSSKSSLILPDFPSPTYAQLLFEAYNTGLAIYYNIIHPVNSHSFSTETDSLR